MAYVTDLSKGYPADDSQQVLSKPLGSSVFAQLLQLNEWLPDDATWEMTPNNVTGILDKNVRPILRDAKNPQLLQTWDLQMKLEADAATNAHNAHKVEVFNSFTRQKLVYQRALDMIALGLPNRATGEIFTLIKTYPQHPDCPIWMAKIRELINRSASAAPGTSPQPTPETSPQ